MSARRSPRRWRRSTPEERERAVALDLAGSSLRAIGRALGRDPKAVSRWLYRPRARRAA